MYEECVNAFRTHYDDRAGWQNEYWGKTMLCYAEAAKYTQDPALKAWIVEKTHAFLKEFQKPNGYLSTDAKEDFLRKNPESPDGAVRRAAMEGQERVELRTPRAWTEQRTS